MAVKVLSADYDPQGAERLEFEFLSLSRLHHPNIVSVYDMFTHDGQSCLVMELIKGRQFGDLISEGVATGNILSVMTDVFHALAYAHSKGLIHGDVKPGNIMITTSGHAKAAGVLIYRMLTWLLLIPTGFGALAVWRFGGRKQAGERDQTDEDASSAAS